MQWSSAVTIRPREGRRGRYRMAVDWKMRVRIGRRGHRLTLRLVQAQTTGNGYSRALSAPGKVITPDEQSSF